MGLRFVGEVEEAIKRILDGPERWRIVDEDIRRCLTHVFPYAILYTIESDFIQKYGSALRVEYVQTIER